MKSYRIGEFAKYLGVTPDLLKYYEEMGILSSQRSDSGYRFYEFSSANSLFESIRLRNYGMTLRDIKDVLGGTMPEDFSMAEYLEKDMDLLKEEITLDQALIDDYSTFKYVKSRLNGRSSEWSIAPGPDLYFLPHTNGSEFLNDPRIYEILKSWMEVIPVVKPALYVCSSLDHLPPQLEASAEEHSGIYWGFAVEKKYLDALHLPVNDAVIHFPVRKVLYYLFDKCNILSTEESFDNTSHPAFSLLDGMNLKPAGDYLRIHLMPSEWGRGLRSHYGYYAVPIG